MLLTPGMLSLHHQPSIFIHWPQPYAVTVAKRDSCHRCSCSVRTVQLMNAPAALCLRIASTPALRIVYMEAGARMHVSARKLYLCYRATWNSPIRHAAALTGNPLLLAQSATRCPTNWGYHHAIVHRNMKCTHAHASHPASQ
jgi:hypothetical protein